MVVRQACLAVAQLRDFPDESFNLLVLSDKVDHLGIQVTHGSLEFS